ncbi:MAG TPA: hypothetical protein VN958_01340 [Chitinophagaceae bacterium]|nr:hypothetical protein [Chitinophagaceae bacterium]
MKKMYFLLMLAGSLLVFTQNAAAQKESVTSSTATKEKGYTIINAGEPITIYKYQHLSHSPKEAEKYAPKYFFTTGSSDVLQELTKMNLKRAFPDEHAFHDALDVNFREDKELINYDDFHKMYKVSRVYNTTVK